MRIDAHHHLWDLTAVSYPWIMDPEPRFFGDHAPIRRDYLLDEFTQDARAAGFEGSVHIQVGAADPMAEAVWVDKVASSGDWPLKQVVFCDLSAPDASEKIKEYQKLSSVVGVRQIVGRSPEEDAATGTNDLLRDAQFVEGLKRAADAGLRFDLQLIPELMGASADVFSKVPELEVALCHAGSPYDRSPTGLENWAGHLRNLSDLENVYCKSSGLGMFDHGWSAKSVAPIISEILSQFGSNRVMFGSNFPVCSLSKSYSDTVAAHKEIAGDSPEFFGKTAAKFYGF